MADIKIISGRARSVGVPHVKWWRIKNALEGRTSLNKDGTVSFASSEYNLNLWKDTFPGINIIDHDEEERQFDNYALFNRPTFNFKRQPMKHQEEANNKIQKLIKENSPIKAFSFFYDPGAGKSKSLTDFACNLYCSGKIDACIIIPPNVLVAEQWVKGDIENPSALQRDIHDSIEYESWIWSKGKKALKSYEELKNNSKLQFITLNIDAVKTEAGFNLVDDFINHHKGRVLFAIDEAHLIKTPSTGRHKKCVELGNKCSWRVALTGTPISKSLIDAWAIFKFLDPRILGHKYITSFKSKYCITRWNGFADEIVGHKNVEEFYEKIEPYTSRISQEELGLEKIEDTFEFDMSDEQRKHFNQLKTKWLTSLDSGEFATVSIALTAALRMQQVTNGYVIGDDGNIQYLDNARMRAMHAWLETISDDKLIIWCRFLTDAQLLMKEFGYNATEISGNVEQSLRSENKNRFLTDSSCRFLIATADAAGTGTDGLQKVCNRALYYSTSENYILRRQSESRVIRIGGNTTAFLTDLICRKSPDRKILNNLTKKDQLSKLSLDEIRKMFE